MRFLRNIIFLKRSDNYFHDVKSTKMLKSIIRHDSEYTIYMIDIFINNPNVIEILAENQFIMST